MENITKVLNISQATLQVVKENNMLSDGMDIINNMIEEGDSEASNFTYKELLLDWGLDISEYDNNYIKAYEELNSLTEEQSRILVNHFIEESNNTYKMELVGDLKKTLEVIHDLQNIIQKQKKTITDLQCQISKSYLSNCANSQYLN